MPEAHEKLIKLFAVEPESIATWSDFRYVFEKFGYSEGRLVVKVPDPGWITGVLTNCQSDTEKKQIEAAFMSGERSLFIPPPAMGGAYSANWFQRARNVHLRRALDGVVVREDVPKAIQFTRTAKVSDCSKDFFGAAGQSVVSRDARSLAAAARELLELSSRVVIVDQYFSSKGPFIRTLIEFLKVASECGCEFVEVMSKAGNCDQDDLRLLRQDKTKLFKGCKGPISLLVKVLEPKVRSVDFHHRLLISNVGGIRYDAGFDDVDAQEENDVAVLNRSFHSKQVSRYLGPLDDFKVVTQEQLTWSADDCRRAKHEASRMRRG